MTMIMNALPGMATPPPSGAVASGLPDIAKALIA